MNFTYFYFPAFSPTPSLIETPFPNKSYHVLCFVCDPLDLFKVLFLSTTDGRLFNEAREASVATPLKKMTPPPPESQSSIIFLYSNTMSYI